MLFRQGLDLVRAEYIPDDIEDIKQTVLRLKERVGPDGVIFSSGGIGPTHDDVTYEALAAAFGMSSCVPCASGYLSSMAALINTCPVPWVVDDAAFHICKTSAKQHLPW